MSATIPFDEIIPFEFDPLEKGCPVCNTEQLYQAGEFHRWCKVCGTLISILQHGVGYRIPEKSRVRN
jgi:hypothetical protein